MVTSRYILHDFLGFILLFFGGILLLTACGGRTDKQGYVVMDSTSLTDTTQIFLEQPKEDNFVASKTTDNYFSDFIYLFTQNKKFQQARIDFPLSHQKQNGAKTQIQPQKWQFTSLHAGMGIYTVFFSDEAELALEQSNALKQVKMQWFYMNQKFVKEYLFNKQEGCWKLHELREYPTQKYQDAEFIDFYWNFANDSVFQSEHLAHEIVFTTADEENGYEALTGTIEAEQWPMFCPELPKHTFTNIDYGQDLRDDDQRIVALEEYSSSFLTMLFFRHTDEGWKLFKIQE